MSLRHWIPPAFLELRRRRPRRKGRPAEQLRGHTQLHLNCGHNILPGWANIDFPGHKEAIRHDLTEPLPMADGSARFVYSEHFIEHLSKDHAQALLGECYRVLVPGGTFRLSTPNLRVLVDEYRAGRLTEWPDVGWQPSSACSLMNEGMRSWGHQFVYDWEELEALLREVGFSRIEQRAWRESEHVQLANLECRPFHGEIVLEARK
jgi:predicted SAM-dependent methyltransferase